MFAGNDAATASNFLNDRYINDFLQPAIDANYQSSAGTPLNSPFYNRNVLVTYFNPLSPTDCSNMYRIPLQNDGFSNFTQLRAQYGDMQNIAGSGGHLAAFNVSDGKLIAANSNLSLEIPWIVQSKLSSSTENLIVTVYPAYYILNAGALWDVTDPLSIQVHVAHLTNQLSFTEGDPLFSELKAPDGTGNRGVARPLFGRTERLTVNYRL